MLLQYIINELGFLDIYNEKLEDKRNNELNVIIDIYGLSNISPRCKSFCKNQKIIFMERYLTFYITETYLDTKLIPIIIQIVKIFL